MIRFEIAPVAKPRMTQRDRWKQRPSVLRYRAYCDELRLKAKAAGYTPNGELNLHFVIPMPLSWTKKKRQQMNLDKHEQKPDIDNLLKGFMDALLPEDSHVWHVQACKIWGDHGEIVICD